MLNIKRMKEIIAERDKTDDEWDYGVEKCWKELTKVLSEDIVSTINYIDTDCSENEYCWMSEVFDDVARETQSQEFVDCLIKYADNHPKVHEDCNIRGSIEFAQAEIKSSK